MTKKSKIEIIISSLIIISSAFIIFIFNNQQQKIDNQTRVAKTELRKKKKKLKAIPNEVQKKLEEANPDSSNLKRVKSSTELKDKGTELMQLMYTINSDGTQKEWSKRNAKLLKLATKDALNGAGSNYKSQGINRMYDLKQTFLSASFSSGLTTDKDALEGIILVNYRQASNQQDNPEQQEQAYLYKYSLKDHKFTSLTLLGIVRDSKY
ncbi:hypothetical protein U2F58_03190 [Lactobacillus johnsonii]|uniref:hypothetical protein n=1 Tax=Lactobacillus TaxID=1578 RepID=UPI00129EC1C7|nr:hypothetical protein [Lactobacillus taiwanensis]MRM99289.1 hypothetical protein [Lactobacillus taiwanensis]